MKIQNLWKRTLTAGLSGVAVLAFSGMLAAQEPSNPSAPPAPGTAQARPGHGGGGVEKRLERLTQQLNLTEEQQGKIRPLLEHEMERAREIRNNTSLSQDEAHQRMQAVRRETNQHIREFLTPEQVKQWQEDRQEHHGGPEGQQQAPDAPPAPQL